MLQQEKFNFLNKYFLLIKVVLEIKKCFLMFKLHNSPLSRIYLKHATFTIQSLNCYLTRYTQTIFFKMNIKSKTPFFAFNDKKVEISKSILCLFIYAHIHMMIYDMNLYINEYVEMTKKISWGEKRKKRRKKVGSSTFWIFWLKNTEELCIFTFSC